MNEDTINLGHNIGNVNQPIFSTQDTNGGNGVVIQAHNVIQPMSVVEPVIAPQFATATSANVVVDNANEITSITNEVVKENVEEKQTALSEPIVVKGDVKVPTVLLRSILAQARKVGTSSNMQPISESVSLEFGKDGLIVRTASGVGMECFECIDRTYVFENGFKTTVDIQLLGNYLNAEKNGELILNYTSGKPSSLRISTKSGSRLLPEKVDSGTDMPIQHKLDFSMNYNDMIPVDLIRLKSMLDSSSSARDLADKTSIDYLQGVYWGDDIIAASDCNVMTIQANMTEFQNKIFFLGSNLCKLIPTIDFIPERFRVGFIEKNGEIQGIILSDGRITICGYVTVNEDFPVALTKNFWRLNEFIQQVTVNTKELYDILKSIDPFVTVPGDELDKVEITLAGDELCLVSLNNTAKEIIKVGNKSNVNLNKKFILSISRLERVLQTVKSDTFELMIDNQSENYVCLSYDGIRSVITTLGRKG